MYFVTIAVVSTVLDDTCGSPVCTGDNNSTVVPSAITVFILMAKGNDSTVGSKERRLDPELSPSLRGFTIDRVGIANTDFVGFTYLLSCSECWQGEEKRERRERNRSCELHDGNSVICLAVKGS